MRRIEFISRSIIAATGVFVIPIALPKNFQLFGDSIHHIPLGSEQIRHGVFGFEPLPSHSLPSWIKFFKRQRLFSNGYEPSSMDLMSTLVQVQNHNIFIHEVQGSVSIIIDDVSFSTSELYESIRLQRGDMTIHALINERRDHYIKDGVVIAATEGVMINGKSLKQYGYSNLKSETVSLAQGSIALMFEKTG
jgi:hypothetical protein